MSCLPSYRIENVTPKDIQRFWNKVDKRGPDECWPWKAGLSHRDRKHPYGAFSLQGKLIVAPRFALYLELGNDPFPMLACHTCDNTICCNGTHLFPGTPKANLEDCARKGRTARAKNSGRHTKPEMTARGESHGRAKLTEEIVKQIRLSPPNVSNAELGRIFSVQRAAIRKARLGLNWHHIQ